MTSGSRGKLAEGKRKGNGRALECPLTLPLFDLLDDKPTLGNGEKSTSASPTVNSTTEPLQTPTTDDVSLTTGDITPSADDQTIPPQIHEPQCSTRIPRPSNAILESRDYQQRELYSRQEGDNWATDQIRPCATSATDTFDLLSFELDDYVACLTETKASHNIPRSYRHAISSDPDRWMVPMRVEMDTLKQ